MSSKKAGITMWTSPSDVNHLPSSNRLQQPVRDKVPAFISYRPAAGPGR